MSDDAPTLPLPKHGSAPPPVPRPPRRTGAIAAFVILCALVVAAIIVLVVILASRASDTTASAPTPSNSSSAASTPASPPTATAPPAAAPVFSNLRPETMQRDCFRSGRGHGRHDHDTANPSIHVSWTTANATEVWIAEGSGDAATAHEMRIPTSGDEGDFPTPLTYDCTRRNDTYTMTLVGVDGAHVSQSWVVQNPRHSVF